MGPIMTAHEARNKAEANDQLGVVSTRIGGPGVRDLQNGELPRFQREYGKEREANDEEGQSCKV